MEESNSRIICFFKYSCWSHITAILPWPSGSLAQNNIWVSNTSLIQKIPTCCLFQLRGGVVPMVVSEAPPHCLCTAAVVETHHRQEVVAWPCPSTPLLWLCSSSTTTSLTSEVPQFCLQVLPSTNHHMLHVCELMVLDLVGTRFTSPWQYEWMSSILKYNFKGIRLMSQSAWCSSCWNWISTQMNHWTKLHNS